MRIETLEIIVSTLVRYGKTILVTTGESLNKDWQYAPMVSLLVGLGSTVVRTFFDQLGIDDDYIQYLASASDKDLCKEALEASKMSGYPWGLLRCPFNEIEAALGDATFDVTPRWLILLTLLHIVKHTRIAVSDSGEVQIIVTYDGRRSFFPVMKEGKDQLISSANNKVLAQGIKQVLRLQAEGWVEAAVAELFSVMTPASLPRVIPLSSRFDIAVCPYVVYKQQVAFRSEKTWVNPGMFISNVAKIDVASRKVDKQYHISGEDIIDLELPGENPNAQAVSEWMDAMPDEVVPERASAIMLRYFGNINTLGYPEGWAAIIDASVTANLTRPQLVGSQVGRALGKERPHHWYLPTDASLDGSTNCGKTLIAVALASITMYGIRPIYSNNSDSAPGIRSMAKPLMKYGGCVIDEFYAPEKPEHPFSYPGLQALATGGLIAPGEALGNADPVGVRTNMHFTAKVLSAPKDILNRSIINAVDVLTDDTRKNGDELSEIESGRISALMRFAHMAWLDENNIVAKIRDMKLEGGIWRFDGHATIATLLADRKDIEGYFAASEQFVARQYGDAVDSGLAEQVSSSANFSILSWLKDAGERAINGLMNLSNLESGLKPKQVLSYLAVELGHHDLEAAARSMRTSSHAMATMLGTELKRIGKLTVGSYTIETTNPGGKTRVWIAKIPSAAPDVPSGNA